MRRRAVAFGGVGLVLGLGALAAWRAVGDAGPPLSGRIAWPMAADLTVMDLPSRQMRKLTDVPQSSIVMGASWSPDGLQLVYPVASTQSGAGSAGADLWIINADGTNAHMFAQRDEPNTMLDMVDWTSGGRVYYARRAIRGGAEVSSIIRQRPGDAAELVIDNATSPSVLADEDDSVFVRATAAGQTLLYQQLDTSAGPCELAVVTGTSLIGTPSVSPDRTRVAVGLSGDPGTPTRPCARSSTSNNRSPALAVREWLHFDVPVAYAHGVPWDLWTVRVDGSNLARLATLQEEDPRVAWSPDSLTVAVAGIGGIYAVDASSGRVRRLVEGGGYGGIDWSH